MKEIKGINKFITNKVTSMRGMFQLCVEIQVLDLSNFNTANVTDMSYMFNQSAKLNEIKGINQFITNQVTNMKYMFNLCSSLKDLDLSSFFTQNVTDMSYMFCGCDSLEKLNLLNFTINCEINCMLTFKKNKCKLIANDPNLLYFFNPN